MIEKTSKKGFFNKIIQYKWFVIASTILVTLFLGSGGRFLLFNNSYKIFFGENNPQLKAFENLQNVYSKTDNVLLVLAPKNQKVFTSNTLQVIRELTKKAWLLPYASRVDSIANYQHTFARGDTLHVEDLIGDKKLSADQINNIRKVVLSEPLLVDRLIPKKGHVTGINVTITLPENNSDAPVEIAQAARRLASEIENKYPEIKIYLTGEVILSSAFSEAAIKDMNSLTPLMYLVIIITSIIILRSFWAIVATLFVVLFSIMSAMGSAGWLGIQLTAPSAIAPTVILTLAIADAIHILLKALQEMRLGRDKKLAICNSLAFNIKPVFLTSLTTAIGFLSLNLSDSPPFHDLGNITALGVIYAFIYSIIFLPAFFCILPIKSKIIDRKTVFQNVLPKVGHKVMKHSKAYLILLIGLFGYVIFTLPNLQLSDKFVEYFDQSILFRQDNDFVMKNLSGVYQIEYNINSKKSNGLADPTFLKSVESFTNWLRNQNEVVHVNSFSDLVKRINQNLHRDQKNHYKIPENRELAAQNILLYEMSLPYGLDLNNQINIDKSSTKVTVTVRDLSSSQIKHFAEKAKTWYLAQFSEFSISEGASPTVMFSHIAERNIKSMFKGTLWVFVIATIIILIIYRNIHFGWISFIVNILPIILALGVWNFLYHKAGFAISIVAPVTFGIIIDDTIHFLSKFSYFKHQEGLDFNKSMSLTFEHVAPALICTSVILLCGFSVLAQSPFLVNSSLGKLSMITIFIALIIDLTLLPILLKKTVKEA